MNILFFGDIVGKPGRKIVRKHLSALKEKYAIDYCIANCENLSHGRGISEKAILEMKSAGVDAFTSGNHLWDKKDSLDFLKEAKFITKPANYPNDALGSLYYDINEELTILSLIGQSFMENNSNSPFYILDSLLKTELKNKKNIFIDFHAEATAEKKAFAFLFDGRISAVLGTHTHVQTVDEQILPKGTGFITDVGMNGSHNSIIGVQKETILKRIITGMPSMMKVAEEGLQVNAIFLKIINGKTTCIKRILIKDGLKS